MHSLSNVLAMPLLGLCLACGDPRPGQVVDEDFRFRLDQPGADWVLMDEAAARRVNPDACAGALAASGRGVIVIVERTDIDDLDQAMRLTFPPAAFTDWVELGLEALEVEGEPARHGSGHGRIDGMVQRLDLLVLLHAGHLYQLVTWSPDPLSDEAFRQALAAFHLLPGEVRGRVGLAVLPDCEGPGWRLRDGVFESAWHGLRVRPPESWRVAVGDELERMGSGTHVGLVRVDDAVYLTLACTLARGVDRDAWRAGSLAPLDGVAWDGDEVPVALAGGTLRLQLGTGIELPGFAYAAGAEFLDDTLVEAIAWTERLEARELHEQVATALSGCERLAAPELERLRSDLATRHATAAVGQTFSLRGGVYRDFAHGFTWQAPDGLWQVTAGDTAEVAEPGDSIDIAAPAAGLSGWIIVERAQGEDLAELHEVDCLSWGDADELVFLEPATSHAAGSATARTTVLRLGEGPDEELCSVTTVVHGGWHVTLELMGLRSNLEEAPAAFRAGREALAFPAAGLQPVEDENLVHRDLRLGFSVRRPSAAWTLKPVPMPGREAMASSVTILHDGDELAVLAMARPTDGLDADWLLGILRSVGAQAAGLRVPDSANVKDGEFAGRPGRVLTWRAGKRRGQMLATEYQGILYGATVLASEEAVPALLAAVTLLP